MDNATIIALVESILPEDQLYGNYIHKGINVSLKNFLDEVLIHFIRQGSTVEQVWNYVKDKILPDVVPAKKVDQASIDLGVLENEDVKVARMANPNQQSVSVPDITLNSQQEIFTPIDPKLGEQYVDDFIKNCAAFVETVRTSYESMINTRDYLHSKIPFMNTDKKILIGESYKSIDEVYNMLLNNSYRSATLEDKTELCLYFASKLEDDVLTSILDGPNITTLEYIRDFLPKMMINSTDVIILGNVISVDIVIDKIAKSQREKIEREKQKVETAKVDAFNRTGEKPSQINEIKVEDKNEDGIEVTEVSVEIPIVPEYTLSQAEVESLSNLQGDRIYGDNVVYYRTLLDDIKQSIEDTNTEYDLMAKERQFKVIVQKALEEVPTIAIQPLIDSISELIGTKRNELIKMNSNYDEYCDAVMNEIEEIKRELEEADNVDAFSEIKYHISRITVDLNEKKIKDIRINQALEQLQESYRQKFSCYNLIKLVKSDFEKKKNKAVEAINDLQSVIRRNYAKLLYVQDPYQLQSIINSTNMKLEAINAQIQEAVGNHFLTEEEARKYYSELNRLNTLGTANNRLKA